MNKAHNPQMIECTFCGRQLAPNAKTCPNCGGRTQKADDSIRFVIIAIAVGSVFVMWLFPELWEYLESFDPLERRIKENLMERARQGDFSSNLPTH